MTNAPVEACMAATEPSLKLVLTPHRMVFVPVSKRSVRRYHVAVEGEPKVSCSTKVFPLEAPAGEIRKLNSSVELL
jgi:hypothetical protein